MNKTIWKYPLTPDCILEMPIGAKILDVQSQHGDPQLWAMVDPAAAKELRRFRTYGTGHPVPDEPGEYIGTFQHSGGHLVFHVFEYLGNRHKMKLEISADWKWAAKDKDGTWHFYNERPIYEKGEWFAEDSEFKKVSDMISGLPDCDWQHSLHRIVSGELVKDDSPE